VKQDGCRSPDLPARGGANHEKVKTQEGQVGHRDFIVWVMRTDSHEDESPEGRKDAGASILGNARHACGCLHLGRRHAQTMGTRPGGQVDGDESSRLRGRNEPL